MIVGCVEKWKTLLKYRGGEMVKKWVGKMGKVGGKVEFCTASICGVEKCTKFCGGFAQSFTYSCTQDFHMYKIFIRNTIYNISHKYAP